MWANFLQWFEANSIGDISSTVGTVISALGFLLTFYKVSKSKEASERAERAAKKVGERIRSMETVVDFASAISLLEEIKRAHRQAQWHLLPDRYAAIRRTLISLRTANPHLSDSHKTTIQAALLNMTTLERTVERALADTSNLKTANINAKISDDIDNLVIVLEEIKLSDAGSSDV